MFRSISGTFVCVVKIRKRHAIIDAMNTTSTLSRCSISVSTAIATMPTASMKAHTIATRILDLEMSTMCVSIAIAIAT